MQVEIRPVLNAVDIRAFYQFNRDLYANDEEYVSHIDQDIEAIFSPKTNSEYDQGNAKRWLAFDEKNKIVGKIAAFYNRKTKQAGIGFCDMIDNQTVANYLFDTGTDWLREKGFDRIEAPVNFGERDKYWGLLVKGFKQPSYQENYNYPYYQKLYENYGFEKIIEQTTSEARPDAIEFDKYQRFSNRLLERGNLRALHYTHVQRDKFVKDFTQVYNQAWKQHEHFVPFTEERVQALFVEMKPIIREDLLWFLYDGEQPVGLYLSLIELNQIFRHLNGSMSLWAKLKFLYYKKTTKIKRIRGIIFGVVPEFQNKGVYSILVMKMYEVMKNDPHIESTELAWIGDFNPKMHALFESLNAEVSKVHFTYQKVF